MHVIQISIILIAFVILKNTLEIWKKLTNA